MLLLIQKCLIIMRALRQFVGKLILDALLVNVASCRPPQETLNVSLKNGFVVFLGLLLNVAPDSVNISLSK